MDLARLARARLPSCLPKSLVMLILTLVRCTVVSDITQTAFTSVAMTAAMQIRFDSEGRVFLNGEDVSSAIRENRVSMLASRISVYPRVRQLLVDMQRQMAAEKGIIMDGRDIGTVVLPDAELKIFMVASVEARARRRYQEYIDKHIEADYQRICEDIQKRDDQDMHRAASPLRKAADAHEIDTSDMSIPEVCDAIMKLAEKTIV